LLHNWVKIRRIRNDHWMGTGAFICVDCFFFTDTIKKAAQKQQNNFIKKFLNVWVICGYILLFGSLFINTFVLRKLELKFLPCITATSFFWVLLFSRIFLGERPSKNKIIGIIMIFIGVIVCQF